MPKVADVLVPVPPALSPTTTGAETVGQAYTLRVPASASDPLVVVLPDGAEHSWTPDAMGYLDEDGNYDYIAGSATVSLSTRGNLAEYQHTYPAAVETFIAEAERVKHYVRLDEPPRAPADTLTGAISFFISGKVGGAALPVGRHDSIPLASFRLDQPDAKDMTTTAGEEVLGAYEVVDGVGGEQYLYMLLPAEYVLDPNRPWPLVIDPTVTTSTSNIATAYSNQRKSVRCAGGNVVDMWQDGSNLKMAVSTDGAQTFGTPATIGAVTTGTYQTGGSLASDASDNLHALYFASGSSLVYRRATPDAGRTTWTWEATSEVFVSGEWPTMVLTVDGTSVIAHCVRGDYIASGSANIWYKPVTIAAGGTRTIGSTATLYSAGTRTGGWRLVPLLLKLSNTQVLAVYSLGAVVSSTAIACKLGTWSAGAMSWGTESVVDASEWAGSDALSGAVDSQGRAVIAYPKQSDGLLKVMRRAVGGTWSALGTVPSATPTSVGVVCNGDDVYVWYTTTTGVYYLKYTAATATWGSAVTVATIANANHVSVRGDTSGSAMDAVVTTGVSSPYNVVHYRISFNQPPLQPSGLTRAAFDATADAAFSWTHNDPDGDGPTAYQLQIINASTGATLKDTGKTASVSSSYTLPAGTAANGVTYQWRVMTWDAYDVASPWSDYATVTTGAKPVPTITSPAAGSTVGSSDVTVQYSVGDQGSATVRRYASDGTTLQDTQTVTSASARARTMTGLSNSTSYQVSVQVTSAIGVVGDEVFSGVFTVSYTPAPTPTLTIIPGADSLSVVIANPPPGAGEPTVTGNDLYRNGVRIATGIDASGTYEDRTVGSGAAYTYVVRACGDNGTYADSAETVAFAPAWTDWRFDPVDGSDQVRFTHNSDVSWHPEEEVQVPATQSQFRRTYRGPAWARLADIQATFSDRDGLTTREWRERLLGYVQAGTAGYLRSPAGDVWRGVLSAPGIKPHAATGWEAIRCQFRETREAV